MYRQIEANRVTLEKSELIFEGKLEADNRWVVMSKLIPWAEFEEEYAKNFAASGMGAPAKSFRIALGSLIIKERLGISDRETVEQIRENPYLQYFLGISKCSSEAIFEASMLVHFRQRIGEELVNRINRRMVENTIKESQEKNSEKKLKRTGKRKIEEN